MLDTHAWLGLSLIAVAVVGCGATADEEPAASSVLALNACNETVPANRSVDGLPAYAQCSGVSGGSIYSNNGIDTSTTSAGSDWILTQRGGGYQCTEWAFRYMHFRWHIDYRHGDAKDWCDGTLPAGLVKSTVPVHGDLIVFDASVCGADATTGHIAVIDVVNGDAATVTLVEENQAGRRNSKQSCALCYLHATVNDGSSGAGGGAGGSGGVASAVGGMPAGVAGAGNPFGGRFGNAGGAPQAGAPSFAGAPGASGALGAGFGGDGAGASGGRNGSSAAAGVAGTIAAGGSQSTGAGGTALFAGGRSNALGGGGSITSGGSAGSGALLGGAAGLGTSGGSASSANAAMPPARPSEQPGGCALVRPLATSHHDRAFGGAALLASLFVLRRRRGVRCPSSGKGRYAEELGTRAR